MIVQEISDVIVPLPPVEEFTEPVRCRTLLEILLCKNR